MLSALHTHPKKKNPGHIFKNDQVRAGGYRAVLTGFTELYIRMDIERFAEAAMMLSLLMLLLRVRWILRVFPYSNQHRVDTVAGKMGYSQQ